MPLPSAVAKAPPSGRLASPARRASQKASPPAESQLSAQNKRRVPQLPPEPGAKNALLLLPPSEVSLHKAGAVLRPGASLPEKRCPSCLPCPEKSLSAAAEAVFATDRLPSRFRQKAPHSAGKRPLRPASEFPRSFRSHERSGHRGPPQLPRLHSVRMPARLLHSTRLLRSDSASAFLHSFHIPTRLLHPGATSPFQNSVPIPQHRSSAALRKPSPDPTPPLPSRCAPAPGTPSSGF